MALRPCVSCSRRFLGKAQHCYVTILLDGDESKLRGPRCPSCFKRAIEWLEVYSERVPEDGLVYLEPGDESKCIVCKDLAQDNYCMFATSYPTKGERRDWYGRLCRTCAQTASDALTKLPVFAT